jgi:dienelactone hydrolase
MIENIEVAGRTAWFARPNGSPRGAIVVCHGGGGLAPHEREVLERLASLGYAAVAPDLYGDTPSVELVRALVADAPELRARVNAAVAWICANAGSRVAVIGHCFGGTAALECARSGADLACAVAFHGGLGSAAPAGPGVIRARVLACCGADDPFCPREQRTAFEEEMTRAGADWQLDVYGGAKHGFTVRGIERPGCAYEERADRRSWAAMLALLDETIGT